MTRKSVASCLTDARNELRQVREWLLQPSSDTLAVCPAALHQAVACLQELALAPDPALKQPLLDLSREIRSTQALLQSAGALYFGRLRRLSLPGQPHS